MPADIAPTLLKSHRKQRGWSQVQLASISKVDIKTIKRIEAAKQPRSSNSPVPERLAAAFGISVQELVASRREVIMGPEMHFEDAIKHMIDGKEYIKASACLRAITKDTKNIKELNERLLSLAIPAMP